MPPTLPTVDELTAAQIKRIYALGYAAGLNTLIPVQCPGKPQGKATEWTLLDDCTEIIERKNELIKKLQRDLVIVRTAAIVLLLVIVLLCIIAGRSEEQEDLVIQPTALRSGRA